MGIQISGVNGVDKIVATDGTIDVLSGTSISGVLTATSFTGNLTGDVTGNLTGNVNHTSNLLLQIGGSEKFRVGSSGQLGIGGANYGTSGQVLQSAGSGAPPTWNTISGTTINNNADNRIITGSGSANTLNGESNITCNGNDLTVNRADGSNRGFVVTHGGTEVARLSNHGTGAEGKLELKNSGTTKISLNGYNGTLQLHGTAGYIIFGDTDTAAHRLDDYEEGNFVPYPVNGWGILNGGATSGGSNAAVALGKYIKIGSLCYIFFTYKEGNSSGASFNGNRIQFYGLPFQAEGQYPTGSDVEQHPIHGFGNSLSSNGQELFLLPDAGSSTVAGCFVRTSGGYDNFTGTNLGNSGQIWFSGCYKVHP